MITFEEELLGEIVAIRAVLGETLIALAPDHKKSIIHRRVVEAVKTASLSFPPGPDTSAIRDRAMRAVDMMFESIISGRSQTGQ